MSVSKIYVGKMPAAKCLQPNVSLQNACCTNVCWPNGFYKIYVGKMPEGQIMPVCKMSFGKIFGQMFACQVKSA